MIGDMYTLKQKSKKEQNVSYASSRLALIAMLWIFMLIMQIINSSSYHFLNKSPWLAIEPRNWKSLPLGLLTSPFLHANWSHFFSNTFSFWVLGFLTLTQRLNFNNAARTFGQISLIILILGGVCTWMLGRSGHHIGASGWIFGLMGYNVAFGIYNAFILKEPKWIGLLISFLMICFYLTTILSALNPFNIFAAEVSGEGHLSFLLTGILVGCYQTTMKKKIKTSPIEDEEMSIEDVEAFEYKLPSLL